MSAPGPKPKGAHGIWAISAHFNPRRYRSRLRNFQAFRRALAVPLAAVELSTDGDFELCGDDADILVQVTCPDVMWQKERLLNLAIDRLPAGCEIVCWLDGDILFLDRDWPDQLAAALGGASLVQLYRDCDYLEPGGGPPPSPPRRGAVTERSFGAALAAGRAAAEMLRAGWDAASPKPYRQLTGIGKAWAMRREDLARHGLYDACILGGGDRPIVCAAAGSFESAIEFMGMDARRARHYLGWAQPFFATVRGRIGHLDGRIQHLWHGAIEDRMYYRRHAALARVGFDPFADIVVGEQGCWRWATPREELHSLCAAFFGDRHEDGRTRAAHAAGEGGGA